ncbi:uncharacterized protein LOC131531394 isoform X8 [Onychostoma macrolepis]|uniref:uncharacterized protein LOC131531394 isoform X8 n=1 Tax=Onychostoma macrolepis TaxID=369639 RepID=UPI00272A2397|nr:uncharacterized protein LOC131531394 isoform X8 [Onychostoma macrolepis]
MFFKSFKVETRKRRGAFGDDKTVKEGDSVVLKTDIQKKKDESMLWYFEDARIALINKDESTSCKYDGEGGRFKDRLEVDYETAFLTITDIRLEHSGLYEAEIIRSESSGKSQSLNRNGAKCDSTKIIKKNNLGEITETTRVNVEAKTEEEPYKTEKEKISGIAVACGLLVAVAVGVICYRRRISGKVMEKNKPGRLLEDQKKDDSDVSYENPSDV